jgi:hypothetical protein
VTIAPIRSIDGGEATLDLTQVDKRPDWTSTGADSGATPADRIDQRVTRRTTP